MKMGRMKKWLVGAGMALFMGTMTVCSVYAAAATNNTSTVSTTEDGVAAPEKVTWDRTAGNTATWRKVKGAVEYQLNLYVDEEFVRTVKVTTNSVDLSEYMKKEGEYYFEVRVKMKDPNRYNKYIYSDYSVSKVIELKDLGDTDGKWKYFLGGTKYLKEDYTYVTNEWYKILGKWYYFDENSYMATGWKQWGPAWYYFNTDGAMQTGWLELEGIQYYFNTDGTMAVGWREIGPGTWNYFYESGAMARNTVIDGYVLDDKGVWTAK